MCVGCVGCQGVWVYMCIWLGWLVCVRRVGMYWKEGEEKLHHYITKFMRGNFMGEEKLHHYITNFMKKFYPINLIKLTKIGNKAYKCSK